MPGIIRNMGVGKMVRLGTNSSSPPPELPDGLITTMNGDMIVLSVSGDYVLTVNGFVPMNALMLPSGDFLKTINNEFITI